MLNKLVGLWQGTKSNHPLGSRESREQVLEAIPQGDPVPVLLDIDSYLEDVSRYDTELTPAELRLAILHFDEFARSASNDLLLAFLLPEHKEYNAELVWSQLLRHNRLLVLAYLHCLEHATLDNEETRMQLALCSVRAMQAWAQFKKLHQFRYKTPEPEWWQMGNRLLGLASQYGALAPVQQVYPDEKISCSALQAYLVGIYLEIAPLANMVMVQVEILHRWLQQHAGVLKLAEQPHPAVTHYIDLDTPAPPLRYDEATPHQPGFRYCSTRRLRAPLLQLAHQTRPSQALPEWLQTFASERDALSRLVQTMLLHWAERPPERSSRREQADAAMRVIHGFSLVRRMIACAAFAKRGETISYRSADIESVFNEDRFGRVDEPEVAEKSEAAVDPMETLLKLETSGDKQMMEEWFQVDVSSTGLGAMVPGLRSRNRIGELIGFRFEGDIEWRIGVIRRISRDAQRRAVIGLETFPVPSLCGRARLLTQGVGGWQAKDKDNGYDAILLSADGDLLLLPAGTYAENIAVMLAIAGQRRNIVLTEKIEAGRDWEKVRFRPHEQEST